MNKNTNRDLNNLQLALKANPALLTTDAKEVILDFCTKLNNKTDVINLTTGILEAYRLGMMSAK